MRAASAAPPIACISPYQLSNPSRISTKCIARVIGQIARGSKVLRIVEGDEVRERRTLGEATCAHHISILCLSYREKLRPTFGGMSVDTMTAVWFS